MSTSLRDSDPRRRGLSDSDSLTATPPKRASFEELRDSWVSMRRSRELVLARESAEVAAPDVSWSDSYVRVTDSGERFAPRVSFPLREGRDALRDFGSDRPARARAGAAARPFGDVVG